MLNMSSSKEKQRKVVTSQENGIPRSPGVNCPEDVGSVESSSKGHTTNSENGTEAAGNLVKCPSPSYVTINETTNCTSPSYTSLTTVNTTSVDAPEVGDPGTGEAGTYVTYVEGSSDQTLFVATPPTTVNGENIPYPVYTVGDSTIYGTTGSAQFYTSTPHAGITYAQEGGITYLVASTTNNDSNDSSTNANVDSLTANANHATRVSPATGDDSYTTAPADTTAADSGATSGNMESSSIWLDEEDDEANYLNMGFEDESMSQADSPIEDLVIMICMNKIVEKGSTIFPSNDILATLKSCPITVQWLLDNFERADGVSLPRSTMYYHYIKHCKDHQLDPVNAASFGKLIRSVFLGLRTRRLGTRGNSKYHYYGIRLKPDSPLNLVDEKMIDELMSGRGNGNGIYHPSPPRGVGISPGGNSQSSAKKAKLSKWEHAELLNGLTPLEASAIQHYLGESSHVISSLPELDLQFPLPADLSSDDLIVFHSLYRELCNHLLEDTVNFQLSEFQRRWRVFFRAEGSTGYALEQQQQYESILPKTKLHAVCTLRPVQDYVRRTDFHLYQHLSNILLPDVLRHIPGVMTQTIRNFAKVVESCLASAMNGFPEDMILVKLAALKAFGQTLRRYTSLNHVAQAARQVLENETQINQMLNDLNRVDFTCVEEQAAWVCGCNLDIVPDLESDFKGALSQHQSLEEWATWLESVVDRVLRPHENTAKYTSVARYFLLKWSFYSSLVIRDLTLRSAASFGSFHLLRLLYDEYMFYLIENRVARAVNALPIAVLGSKKLTSPLRLESAEEDEDSESFDNTSNQDAKHLLSSALSVSP